MNDRGGDKDKRGLARAGAAVLKYLPPAPLLNGEDERAYKALRARIFEAVKPQDVVEEMFSDDVVNLQWELMRWRRLKVAFLNREQKEDAHGLLIVFAGRVDLQKILKGWAQQDPEETENLRQLLATQGVSMDELAAKTLARKLEYIERLDTLAATAEARRTHALRELQQHRECLAKVLQSAIKDVEEGEFTEVGAANANAAGDADAA